MKKLDFHTTFLIPLIVFSITLGVSCSNNSTQNEESEENVNPLIGEWKFVSSEAIFPDTTITLDSSMYYSVYMVGDGHFSFFYSSIDLQNLIAAGRGSYLLEGNKYIENVEFHSSPFIIGTSVVFESHIEGDLWIHDGYLPVREQDGIFSRFAKGNQTFRLIETRRRIKPDNF